jgi:hypothetical protein
MIALSVATALACLASVRENRLSWSRKHITVAGSFSRSSAGFVIPSAAVPCVSSSIHAYHCRSTSAYTSVPGRFATLRPSPRAWLIAHATAMWPHSTPNPSLLKGYLTCPAIPDSLFPNQRTVTTGRCA